MTTDQRRGAASMGGREVGRALYYEESGEGVPILLIHPAGATASTWGAVLAELADAGRASAPKMVRVTRKLAGVIPIGVFRQLDAAGHAAPFDAPGAFARLITGSIAAA